MLSPCPAKTSLDKLIKKSRVHFYKPIQIAEILYRFRINEVNNLQNVEEYRTASKSWRDEVSLRLINSVCTSSSKFQDNLFEGNAIPPSTLIELGNLNGETGVVERYIYSAIRDKHSQLDRALAYCINANAETFSLNDFLSMFWNEPGLKRSLDKIFEIVVFSLFETIVSNSGLKLALRVDGHGGVLKQFPEFTQKVLGLESNFGFNEIDAHFHRVGVTNAADRGLDMFANFGSIVQIKHLDLSEKIASDVVSSVAGDRIVIVCKKAEYNIVEAVLNQLGFSNRIQAIVTKEELSDWYIRALRGDAAEVLSNELLGSLTEQIQLEFPSLGNSMKGFFDERNYNF